MKAKQIFIASLILFLLISFSKTHAQYGSWTETNLHGNYSATGTYHLYGIYMTDPNNGWCVGDITSAMPLPSGFSGSMLLTSDGGNTWWDRSSLNPWFGNAPGGSYLTSVWFASASEGWACGTNGMIIHTNNPGPFNMWDKQTSGTTRNLWRIQFADNSSGSRDGYCVGDGGIILKTTNGGTTWVSLPNASGGVNLNLLSVVGSTIITGPIPVYVGGNPVGYNLMKSKDGGATWIFPNPNPLGLVPPIEVQMTDPLNGYYVGTAGALRATTNGGIVWQWLPIDSVSAFNSLRFIDQYNGWVFATGDNIWYTNSGGTKKWTQFASPSTAIIHNASFPNALFGYACGEDAIIKYDGRYPITTRSKTTFDFGTLLCESFALDTVLISNTGTKDDSIFNTYFDGPNPQDFSLISPTGIQQWTPLIIPPGGTVPFIVQAKPTTWGDKTATLVISHNAPIGNPSRVRYKVHKDSSGFRMANSSIAFSPACIGTTNQQVIQTFATGNVNPVITSLTQISGDNVFTITSPPVPYTAPFSNPLPFTIKFQPTDYKPYSAIYRMEIQPCNRVIMIYVTGVGAKTNLTVNVSGGVDFGKVEVNDSLLIPIRINNVGNTYAHVTDFKIRPPVRGLSIPDLPTFPWTFGAYNSTVVHLKYMPDTLDNFNSTVCITWDQPCPDSVCFTIKGRSVRTPSILSPGIVTFDRLLCNTQTQKTLYVKNMGHSGLNIFSSSFDGTDKANFTYINPPLPQYINPNDSLPITIEFNSTTAGDKTAALILNHDDSLHNPSRIALVGKKDEIKITMDGDTVAWRRVCIKDSSILKYQIRNSGTTQMTITSVKDVGGNPNFTFKPLALPITLDVNGMQELDVVFKPTTIGLQQTRLQINADPCGAQLVLTVSALGSRTDFTSTPKPVQFGDVKIGTNASRMFYMTNVGVSAQITNMFFTPPVAGLSIVPAPKFPMQWNPNYSDSIQLQFAPTITGNVSTIMNIIIQSECPDTLRIPVLARATSTSIAVNRVTMPINVIPCDNLGRCDTVRISNTGTSDLIIKGLSIDQTKNIFSLSTPPTLPLTLTAGKSELIYICASGKFIGNETGKFIITCDDPQRPTVEIPLSASRDSSKITINTATIDFGILNECSNAKTFDLTVSNTGTIADSVVNASNINSPFSIATPLPLRLNPGEIKTIRIVFTPTSTGIFNGVLALKTGVCGIMNQIPLKGTREAMTFTVNPSPFDFGDVTVSVPANKNLILKSGHGNKSRITKIIFQPVSAQYTTSATFPLIVDSMGTVNIPFTFTPNDTGKYFTSACLVFDLPCADTMCVSLTGRGARGQLKNSDNQIVFGNVSQCEQKRDTLTVTNQGNIPVNLLSSTMIGAGSTYLQIINPITGTETLPSGASRSFYIVFNSGAAPDGIYNATLRIVSDDSQRPTIDIPVSGTRTTQTMPILSVTNFGFVILGQQGTQNIIIQNNSTSEFCITAIRNGIRFISNITLPQCIKAGQQLLLPVTFAPVDSTLISETLRLIVTSPCVDSIAVPVAGRGAQGAVSQTLQIAFGTVARCQTIIDTIKISNRGNTPVTFQGVTLTGTNANQFTIISQPTPPKIIAPGQQEFIVIQLTMTGYSDGPKTATIQTTLLVNGQPQQFFTLINANVTTDALQANTLSFPQTTLGANSQQTIILTNTSALPITLNQVSVNDLDFTIVSTLPILPATIPPGGTISLTIRFSPQTAKMYSVTLSMRSTAPCLLSYPYTITGEGVELNVVQARLSIPTMTGKPLDRILIPITIQNDLGSADVTSFTGSIRFNRTMLYPHGIVTENSLSKKMNIPFTYDHTIGEVSIRASGGNVIAGTGALFYLDCEVLVGDSVETPIRIGSQFAFTTGRAVVAQRIDGMFQLDGYCLCDGKRLMKVDGQFKLHQNYPNPFNPVTEIQYQLAEDGIASLTIRDGLGRDVIRLVHEFQKAGLHKVTFDANTIPSGMYYYILTSGRFFAIKKMIVTK